MTQSGKNYIVRKMRREEMDLAIAWAAQEGWNPGLHDANFFYETDPNGYFIGLLGDEPIGCISAVAWNQNFGFLGFYIVKPEHRGKGFGIQIWNKGMAYLGDRNIGLDGVVAQQENYKKSGFKLAYRNIRYEGIIDGVSPKNVVELSKIPKKSLLEYDQQVFPTSREKFLQNWIRQPQGVAYGVMFGNQLTGYGVIRKCGKGYKIGPLNADDKDIAGELLQALTAHTKGQPVYLDTPEVNTAAIKLAEKNNMKVVFETARMYTKFEPKMSLEKIFGVTTFEIG